MKPSQAVTQCIGRCNRRTHVSHRASLFFQGSHMFHTQRKQHMSRPTQNTATSQRPTLPPRTPMSSPTPTPMPAHAPSPAHPNMYDDTDPNHAPGAQKGCTSMLGLGDGWHVMCWELCAAPTMPPVLHTQTPMTPPQTSNLDLSLSQASPFPAATCAWSSSPCWAQSSQTCCWCWAAPFWLEGSATSPRASTSRCVCCPTPMCSVTSPKSVSELPSDVCHESKRVICI